MPTNKKDAIALSCEYFQHLLQQLLKALSDLNSYAILLIGGDFKHPPNLTPNFGIIKITMIKRKDISV